MQKQKNAIHKGWKPTLLTSNILLLFFILLFLSFVLILYSLTPACRQAGEADLNERHTNIPSSQNETYSAEYSVYSDMTLLTVSAAKRNFPEEISLLSTIQHTTELEHMFNKAEEWESLGEFYTTGYCKCEKCCGKWADFPTASGEYAVEGVTVGADWETLPAGTVIYIDGLGERIVQDKPSKWIVEKYDGRILDVYYSNHSDAWAHGLEKAEVWVRK